MNRTTTRSTHRADGLTRLTRLTGSTRSTGSAGEPEQAFPDDVPLDLLGPAVDGGAPGVQVPLHPQGQVGVVGPPGGGRRPEDVHGGREDGLLHLAQEELGE